MIGHEVKLSETNAHGCVAVCECGWIGTVHNCRYSFDEKRKRQLRNVYLTQSFAIVEHGAHLDAVRSNVAAQSMAAMASSAAYVQKVAPTIRKIGRWGSG